MTFTYNNAVPAAANNPSNDQPDMLTNTQSINSIIAVDHATFNTANGGTHTQVHLPNFTNPSVINGTANEGSVVYSVAGIADSGFAQLTFKNDHNLNFPLNLIRAFAVCDTLGNIISSQSFNVTSVVRIAGPDRYRVTLPVNVITGTTNYSVFSQCMDFNLIMNAQLTNATSFDMRPITNLGIAQYPIQFWFIVLQL